MELSGKKVIIPVEEMFTPMNSGILSIGLKRLAARWW